LNLKFLIQPSENLLVELTRIHFVTLNCSRFYIETNWPQRNASSAI